MKFHQPLAGVDIKPTSNRKAPGHDQITNLILKNTGKQLLLPRNTLQCLPKNEILFTIMEIITKQLQAKNQLPYSLQWPNFLIKCLRLNKTIKNENIVRRLTKIIEGRFENKEYTLILILDPAQPFDSVWHNGIKYEINSINAPKYLKAILFPYIDEKSFQISIHNKTLTN